MQSKIFKNTSYLLAAQVLVKILAFFYTLFLARFLGVEAFGLLSAVLAIFSLVSAASEFGFNRYLTRQLSIKSRDLFKLLYSTILLRAVISLIILILFGLVLPVVDSNHLRSALILLVILAVIPQSIASTIDSVLVARQKFFLSAVGTLVFNVSSSVLGIWLILNGYAVIGAVLAIVLGQFIYLAGMTVFLKIQTKQSLVKKFILSKPAITEIINGSLPYGILGILGLIYFKVDTLMLSYLRGNFETGIYGAGYKFLEAVVFIPNALAVVMFPIFSRLQPLDKRTIKKLYYKTLISMVLVGSGVSLLFVLVLPGLIKAFLPSYILSIEIVKILAWAAPFMFVHVVVAQIVLSSEKYIKQVILLSLIPLIFNITANLIFIPAFGYLAAAWITVLSDLVSMLALLAFLHFFYFKSHE